MRVQTEDPQLRGHVCERAVQALSKLAACGLELTEAVTIAISKRLGPKDHPCLGLYHRGGNRIDFLDPDAFGAAHMSSAFCATLPAGAHFDSIFAHELGHAVLDQAGDIPAIDQEYIAYAMQLASLPGPVRDAFLADTRVSRPVSTESIESVTLSLSPAVFSGRAYLHFSGPGNGCGFVERLVRGEATLVTEDYP